RPGRRTGAESRLAIWPHDQNRETRRLRCRPQLRDRSAPAGSSSEYFAARGLHTESGMNPQRTPTPTVSPPPHVPAVNADVPADSDHPLHKRLSHVLPAVIVLLLAALVLVPTL